MCGSISPWQQRNRHIQVPLVVCAAKGSVRSGCPELLQGENRSQRFRFSVDKSSAEFPDDWVRSENESLGGASTSVSVLRIFFCAKQPIGGFRARRNAALAGHDRQLWAEAVRKFRVQASDESNFLNARQLAPLAGKDLLAKHTSARSAAFGYARPSFHQVSLTRSAVERIAMLGNN